MRDGTLEHPGRTCRVVAAAGNLFGLLTLQGELEDMGFNVVACAADGAQAVHAAASFEPRIVIVELDNARSDLFAAAHRIDSERIAPVVALIPQDASRLASRLLGLPAIDCLRRPLQTESVVPRLEIAAERWWRTREIEERIAGLRDQIATRDAVYSAKRMLMDRYDWKEADAYRYLRTLSMNVRKPMAVVAERIVSGRLDVGAAPFSLRQDGSHVGSTTPASA